MADKELEIINPPNTLKMKVREGGAGAVDLATLERAEAAIANMTDSYLEWVVDDLKKLEESFFKLRDATGDRKKEADDVFQIAHDIKGQGGSFGYDLMTIVGNELCRLIEKLPSIGPSEIEAIRVHVEAMKLVIQNKMKDDGGPAGQALVSGIRKVGAKLLG